MRNVYDTLKERGFIASVKQESVEHKTGEADMVTDVDAIKKLFDRKTTIYQGFDPSADSLHLGSFLGLMGLHHMQEAGNRIIVLVGGGTGKVGDPSGKNKSRKLMTQEDIDNNVASLKKQIQDLGLLNFNDPNKAILLDNNDWLGKAGFLDDFMMKVARYFSVNDLVKMETFAKRLKDEESLSLLEFLYAAMQAWDYLELYDRYDCKIQAGGSDQWGNILQGVNLIRSHYGKKSEAQALTFPLLTTANGVKMGKTEKGPVWLDAKKTSPFDLYQYIEKTPDNLVEKLFGLYTFLDMSEIKEILKNEPRDVQKRLAYEVTKVVHGQEEAEKASVQSTAIFSGVRTGLDVIPEFKINEPTPLDDILVMSGSLPSKSEVARRVQGGGVKIDDEKITDPKIPVDKECLVKYGKTGFLKIIL